MIENFTLDTDANPQNMNKIIEGINKNEEDIEKLQTSVEGVSSQIGQNTHDIAQLSNPNLLINGDFKVWQRGTGFERISGKYTADRWLYDTPGKASGFNGKIEKITNGLKLTQLDGLSMNHRFRYLMEVLESLKGQKLTLTLKYKTNKVFGVSFLGNNLATVADSNVNTLKVTGTYIGDLELFSIAHYNNMNTSLLLELYSVKIELGEIATPLSPRSYGEELALCQRYYEFIIFSTRIPVNINTGTTGGYEFNYPFKTTKRIQPTQVIQSLKIDGNSKVVASYLNIYSAGLDSFGSFTPQNNTNWNLPAGTRVEIESTSDAEIY